MSQQKNDLNVYAKKAPVFGQILLVIFFSSVKSVDVDQLFCLFYTQLTFDVGQYQSIC